MARFISKESTAGMSQLSWLRLPITSVIAWRNSCRRRHGTWPSTDTSPDVGYSNPRQHLQGGRLAGPVRSEEPHDLARLDRERDPVDRFDVAVLPPDQAPQSRLQPGLPGRHHEGLAKVLDEDVWVPHSAPSRHIVTTTATH